jgi:hypothetical protein
MEGKGKEHFLDTSVVYSLLLATQIYQNYLLPFKRVKTRKAVYLFIHYSDDSKYLPKFHPLLVSRAIDGAW